MKKNTKIFCCFPGTGKSYMKAHEEEYNFKILDSDSSEYHWIYENGEKKENPNFIPDYIQHIMDCFNSKEYDYIFVSTHTKVLDELENSGLPFSVVIPLVDCKDTYMDRYKARGNDFAFIDRLYKNWNYWICDLNEKYKYDLYTLDETEYVADIIQYLECETEEELRMFGNKKKSPEYYEFKKRCASPKEWNKKKGFL